MYIYIYSVVSTYSITENYLYIFLTEGVKDVRRVTAKHISIWGHNRKEEAVMVADWIRRLSRRERVENVSICLCVYVHFGMYVRNEENIYIREPSAVALTEYDAPRRF